MNDLKVYVLMPVANPDRAAAAGELWTSAGYRMVFYQDSGTLPYTAHPTISGPYLGVWNATNILARLALQLGADVCLFAGDDMTPDSSRSPQQIALDYLERFPTGYGVMQPCGDPQGKDASGRPAAARICGSAWFGREWITRSYEGLGPTDGRYRHYYGDESLYEVALMQGVLWMRPELTQYHHHWSWGHTPRQSYHEKHLTHWDHDKRLFLEQKALGFPGSGRA